MTPQWVMGVRTFEELDTVYPNPVAGMFCWVSSECTSEYLSLGHCSTDGTWDKDQIWLTDINSDVIEIMYGYNGPPIPTLRFQAK